MDFNILENKIEKAAKNAFIEMYEKHKEEGIYCFALYSDDGAMTVCPATNTNDFIKDFEEEDLDYYKFESAEWKYEMMGADEEFDEICKILYDELSKNNYENEYSDEKVFYKFRNQLFQTCINVLKKLKKEDFFKKLIGTDIFLQFTVSDYELDRDEVRKMIIELNDNHYKDEYLKWMKTWAE